MTAESDGQLDCEGGGRELCVLSLPPLFVVVVGLPVVVVGD